MHLPKGATAIDFAFNIHTEVGIHCSGAKVNGKLVPLATELNTSDEVEILTSNNQTPSHDWLKIVKTPHARNRIKRWLKQQGHDESLDLGKQMLERKLKELRIDYPSDETLQEACEKLNKKTIDALFASLGDGTLARSRVIDLIKPKEEAPEPGFVQKVIDKIRGTKGIQIDGMSNMVFRYAGCCQPIPGEDIVGFITRGRGVTIHRSNCNSAIDLHAEFPERQIDVSWDSEKSQSFIVELELIVEERKNMLRDITQAIADADTNVRAAEMSVKDTTAVGKFVVEVSSLSHLKRIFEKVKKIKGVISIFRSKGASQFEEE